jgi:hypothetical protein
MTDSYRKNARARCHVQFQTYYDICHYANINMQNKFFKFMEIIVGDRLKKTLKTNFTIVKANLNRQSTRETPLGAFLIGLYVHIVIQTIY